MSYITPDDLQLWFGVKELAQIAVPDDLPPVTPELMRLTIAQEERDDFTPEEINAAEAGLLCIQRALANAEELVKSYLGVRYSMAMTQEQIQASPIPRTCGAIARRLLHHDQVPDEVNQGYEMAMQWLKDVTLGQADLEVTGTRLALFDSCERVFDHDQLRGYV